MSGTIKTGGSSSEPIFVALYREKGKDRYALQAYSFLKGPGEFQFVQRPGDYYLVAFEDVNKDSTFQTNERVGWYGAPTVIHARPGTKLTGFDVVLQSPELAGRKLPKMLALGVLSRTMKIDGMRLGDVVDLDDPDFSPKIGELGLWYPEKFVQTSYDGIFFLEPYSSDKIPVLFIHGIGGSARVWRNVISKLDRSRFQPWIVQYPSGLELGLTSSRINRAIFELRQKHNFDSLFVVAHSMGGLIARDFINQIVARRDSELVKLLVTISTPWQGHPAAQLGTSYSPVVVPSWYDIVPGSPYIHSILARPLPGKIPHYLMFSHRGSYDLMSGGNSDGSVTLRSQLPYIVQDSATKVIGYDEDHVSILNSESVAQRLNQIMAYVEKEIGDARNAS